MRKTFRNGENALLRREDGKDRHDRKGSKAAGCPWKNIRYGRKSAVLVKLIFTSRDFCAKLSLFQKDILFGCLIGDLRKAERLAFLPAAPFLAAFVFGLKKGDGQYEYSSPEAQAEKENPGNQRFFF
ncbi:MAG: hypothetical protein PUD63_07375 [Clostridia bacterium]|nr:hypothetical protein [Clostridia bacterium]